MGIFVLKSIKVPCPYSVYTSVYKYYQQAVNNIHVGI